MQIVNTPGNQGNKILHYRPQLCSESNIKSKIISYCHDILPFDYVVHNLGRQFVTFNQRYVYSPKLYLIIYTNFKANVLFITCLEHV